MTNNELKPCPFCGEKATIIKISKGITPDGFSACFQLNCDKCRYSFGVADITYQINEYGETSILKNGLKDLFEKWNNRADTPERLTDKEVKMINEEVKELK